MKSLDAKRHISIPELKHNSAFCKDTLGSIAILQGDVGIFWSLVRINTGTRRRQEKLRHSDKGHSAEHGAMVKEHSTFHKIDRGPPIKGLFTLQFREWS